MPRYRLTPGSLLSLWPQGVALASTDFRPDPASQSFLFGFPADTKEVFRLSGLDSAPNLEAL